jgi:hypothetical protein
MGITIYLILQMYETKIYINKMNIKSNKSCEIKNHIKKIINNHINQKIINKL